MNVLGFALSKLMPLIKFSEEVGGDVPDVQTIQVGRINLNYSNCDQPAWKRYHADFLEVQKGPT